MKRNKKSCELAIHFNKFPHNLSDFNFIVIEKIMNTDGDLDNTLLIKAGGLLGSTIAHTAAFWPQQAL